MKEEKSKFQKFKKTDKLNIWNKIRDIDSENSSDLDDN